jgi:hypothetical protein
MLFGVCRKGSAAKNQVTDQYPKAGQLQGRTITQINDDDDLQPGMVCDFFNVLAAVVVVVGGFLSMTTGTDR